MVFQGDAAAGGGTPGGKINLVLPEPHWEIIPHIYHAIRLHFGHNILVKHVGVSRLESFILRKFYQDPGCGERWHVFCGGRPRLVFRRTVKPERLGRPYS